MLFALFRRFSFADIISLRHEWIKDNRYVYYSRSGSLQIGRSTMIGLKKDGGRG